MLVIEKTSQKKVRYPVLLHELLIIIFININNLLGLTSKFQKHEWKLWNFFFSELSSL